MTLRSSEVVERMHLMTWEWMQKRMAELDAIGDLARKEMKNPMNALGLADKVELSRIAKRARDGHMALAKIFGKEGTK